MRARLRVTLPPHNTTFTWAEHVIGWTDLVQLLIGSRGAQPHTPWHVTDVCDIQPTGIIMGSTGVISKEIGRILTPVHKHKAALYINGVRPFHATSHGYPSSSISGQKWLCKTTHIQRSGDASTWATMVKSTLAIKNFSLSPHKSATKGGGGVPSTSTCHGSGRFS